MNAVHQALIHGDSGHSRQIGSNAVIANIARVAKVLWHWRERAIQRRQLAGLTPWELDDVGISADAAAAEAAKPFWRA